ncbi:class I SAM-dependent methyltransferase [Roseovarius sp. SCSIO 43702]|uniref:class I SAM-dependent methyltransferase n=1 Tax=Roseovarius sp. SCSIO 43702 TaxID=2823043 RepID=UPI001C735B5F|nr:class I SAM-dependent methyltransferase [Roseovarius sp. SCSIO 43702]QYX55686.1 class I SAM-dependent methyltransferase [Roseovarius sp. SCSIO 43702]
MNCRHCRAPLELEFLNLGHAPPSNAYLDPAALNAPEKTYPLRVKVCQKCRLVQTEDYAEAEELFNSDYAYFSSTSRGWLEHASRYVTMIVDRLGLNGDSHVIEVACNDGYLLRNFVEAGIPCLGIEPTASTAEAAEALSIPVLREFFGAAVGRRLAREGKMADLVCGNNVYAHVPDINDFTRGLASVLKPDGVITLEFPHLLRLVEQTQFDTIYHEHFSYLSLLTASKIFEAAGLRIFDLEHLSTHGGSLRIYGCHAHAPLDTTPAVGACIERERAVGVDTDDFYTAFQSKAEEIKNNLMRFLLQAHADRKSVAAYGAAAKGNTLLNFAGVRPDLIPFVCDAAKAKQGKFMPGSHIPILPPEALDADPPDYVLILPWNIAEEVKAQLSHLAAQGSRFVTAIPELHIT